VLAFIASNRFGGSKALSLFRPSRRRTQLTVARETPTCTAICLLVQRGRRSRSISTTATAGVTDGADAGMSDPATRPILHGDIDQPTSERSAGITPAASATASGVCPLSTSCTIRSRPAWREPGILVHVHPVLPRIAEASQPSVLSQDRVDNLMKAHS
jgi:hypothetical protein